MKKVQLLCASAILSLAVAAPVYADDDSGWYLGASWNRLSADQDDFNDVDFDDSDDAFGFRGGYMFTDMFGIEGGYIDLGDYQTRGNDRGIDLSLDADGWYLAGVLNFSFAENWDVYGKLGVFTVDSDTDFTDFDESSTEAYGAVGVEYDFGYWNIFGEFSVVDTDINDLTTDILSLGVKYEFGR